jgi:chemotaxis protein histidine kinase CheA
MRGSIEGFLAAIKEAWPEVEEALDKVLNSATEGEETMTKSVQEQLDAMAKRLDGQDEELKKARAERDVAVAISKMSASERSYYDALAADTDKDAFLKMDTAGRASVITKAAEAHETITIGGQIVTKAAAGPMFAILKAQQAQIEETKKQAAEAEAARYDAELLAQAEDEMAHLPGDVAMKAKVLRVINEIEDEEVQEAIGKMLACGDKAVQSAFQRLGTNGAGNEEPIGKSHGVHDFMKSVAAIKSRDKCTHQQAMQRAQAEHPEQFEDYQSLE